MALQIISPKYSFVQFNETIPTSDCSDPAICLPVTTTDDLNFQFNVTAADETELYGDAEAGELFTYRLVVCTDCSDLSNVELDEFGFPRESFNLLSEELEPLTGVALLVGAYGYTESGALFDDMKIGDCFTLCLVRCVTQLTEGEPIKTFSCVASTNCFKKSNELCFTSLLRYDCNEDAFGFNYTSGVIPPNRIRLPMYLKQPDYKQSEKGYQFSDGTYKKQYERIDKEYTLETDYLTEALHDRINVALSSDTILITNGNIGIEYKGIYKSEAYKPKWNSSDSIYVRTAKAFTKVILNEPLSLLNSNCG